ncbi:MAG: potassium channel family protein [Candidatus Methanomethylophilaceae archaeon]|jgi:hypothetical protein
MMSITAYWKTLIATFFILICIIAAGTFLFKFLESDWSFIDSAYFTASSVFTVGYGDLSVAPEHRAITGFFLIAACTLALASSSAIGNSFISIIQHRALVRRNKMLMLRVQKTLLEAKKGGIPDEEITCLRTSLDADGDDTKDDTPKRRCFRRR